MNIIKKTRKKMEFVINPKTKKKIKVGGPTYKQLLKEGINFGQPQTQQQKEQRETQAQKEVINPRTNKKIKVGGPTYNKLIREGVVFNIQEPVIQAEIKKKVERKGKEERGEEGGEKRGKGGKDMGGKGGEKGEEDVQAFTVNILKERLKALGLPTKGKKAELLERYIKATKKEQNKKIEEEIEVPNLFLHSDKREEDKREEKREDKGFCEIKHENVVLGRTLSPVRRKSVQKEKEPEIKTKRCLACFDEIVEGQGISCPQCKEVICSECKSGLVKPECPHCRFSITRLFSPRSKAVQEKKLEQFKKEMEVEKTRWDEEIARELQRALNNEYQAPFQNRPQQNRPLQQNNPPKKLAPKPKIGTNKGLIKKKATKVIN